jgi:hypothetical protein
MTIDPEIKYYGTFTYEGRPIGFYNNSVHTPEKIPLEAVQISKSQWQDMLENQGLRKMVNGELIALPERTPPTPAEEVAERTQSDQIIRALIEVLADLTGTTPQNIRASIAQKIAR